MKFHIPIKLPSLANARMHWQAVARLKKSQHGAVLCCLVGKEFPPGPWLVTITRIGPRMLDDDNLQGACKHVRDQIASVMLGTKIGVGDGGDCYEWRYAQRIIRTPRGALPKYGVDVEIVTRDGGAV